MEAIHVACPAEGIVMFSHPLDLQRVTASGNFLWGGGEKFFIKGVSYGTFAPNDVGEPFPPPPGAAVDLALMRAGGFNVLRTYDTPPTWLLDPDGELGLHVLAGLPWPQHIAIADSPDGRSRNGIFLAALWAGKHESSIAGFRAAS